MKTFPTLVKLLFKNWMRDKSGVFFGVLFPVILLLVFGTVFGGPPTPNYTLYVRNLDVDENNKPTPLSAAMIEALNNSVFEVILLKPGDPNPSFTGFAEIGRVLTIPKGFNDDLLNMTTFNRLNITVDTIMRMVEMAGENIPPETKANIMASIQSLRVAKESINAEKALVTLEGNRDDILLAPIASIVNIVASRFELGLLNISPAMDVKTVFAEVKQLTTVEYYLPAFVAAFIVVNGLTAVSGIVSDMNRRQVTKLLASTPVSKAVWILSQLAVMTAVSLLLTAVMLVVGWMVFGMTLIPDLYSLAVIFIGAVAFTGFGILIGSVVKEAEAVNALGNAIAFPMMFLSGVFWPIDNMPEFLRGIPEYLPLYHFHVALRQTLIVGSVETALFSIAIIAVMAVIGVLLAIATVRWRDF